MHNLLPFLVDLNLYGCPEHELVPKRGFASNLLIPTIHYCDKLFGHRMKWGLQGLYSLGIFIIEYQGEDVDSFSEEVLLPSTLLRFNIIRFPHLKLLNGKGFQHLTLLKELAIDECNKLECILEEGLPTSPFFLLYILTIALCT